MREDLGKGVPVIAIDNVAKYVLVDEARQQWDLADIPNAGPPWPLAWYEFRVPGKYVEDFPEELAWWVDAEERDEGGWRLHCYAWGWIRGHTDVVGPMGGHIVDVATDGTVEMLTPMGFKGWTPELAYGTLTYLLPVLMANSFAHCRNVREEVVTPPEKLSRAYRRRHGVNLTRYSVLLIDPMREVLRTEGRAGKVGELRALHICRGHFKTFDEKPLFGKVQGTYWWPAHVRGKAEAGEVRKGYRVKALATGGVEVEVEASAPSESSRPKYPSAAQAREVELFSVDRALEYLRISYPGTEVEIMPHSNPGYDLRVGQADDPIRYVEVKGTTTDQDRLDALLAATE
jgi:hypothetical protein